MLGHRQSSSEVWRDHPQGAGGGRDLTGLVLVRGDWVHPASRTSFAPTIHINPCPLSVSRLGKHTGRD